jgi:hypothetical protein
VSPFAQVKRRLGAALHARSYWPQCRELLLLVVTFNVMLMN